MTKRTGGAQCSAAALIVALALIGVSAPASHAADEPAAGAPAPAAKPPLPSVIVETIQEVDVSASRTFTGRIEAMEKVGVRARVDGFLKPRKFEEGAMVKKGDVLFEIDPSSYQVNVTLAEANLANAEAARALAQITLDRQQELYTRNSGAISKQQIDQSSASLKQADAVMKARQSDLENAKLMLGYTIITAPFDGKVGRAAYSTGEYVGPSSQPLVSIVQQDPMYVSFPLPQAVLLESLKDGRDKSDYFLQITLADGSVYPEKGKIEFADVSASASTDSVTVRARMANPKGYLIDQQIVQVAVVRNQSEKRLLMPQSALLLDQQGSFTLTVDASGKVGIARLKLGAQRGSAMVVEQGLKAGDRVVVSGHQKARPGQMVAAVEAPK
jgi:membrane fusion protein (multidrug efflux system)